MLMKQKRNFIDSARCNKCRCKKSLCYYYGTMQVPAEYHEKFTAQISIINLHLRLPMGMIPW